MDKYFTNELKLFTSKTFEKLKINDCMNHDNQDINLLNNWSW